MERVRWRRRGRQKEKYSHRRGQGAEVGDRERERWRRKGREGDRGTEKMGQREGVRNTEMGTE